VVAARKGNIGSVVSAGPLLWVRAGNRQVLGNHSGLAMPRTSGVTNLQPPRAEAVLAAGRWVRESRDEETKDFDGR
jgi:hypothetical protein